MRNSSMALIRVNEIDGVHARIITEQGILQELYEYFSFTVPGAEFSPSVRNGFWDGKIHLVDKSRQTIYAGLESEIQKIAGEMGYEYDYSPINREWKTYTEEDVNIVAENIGLTLSIRPYQMEAILSCLNNRRQLLLSPTASGKSLIIYMIIQVLQLNTLIIVPNISLVEQMTSDFADYGMEADNVHKIYYGKSKTTDKSVTISTWQSLAKQSDDYFKQFDVVIGDECLHPDTEITMADSTTKKIKDIQIGDMVLTFSEETKQVESKKVIKVHENISIHEDFYEIETIGSKIKITGNHKVLLETGVWKRVDDLEIGDIINTIE